MKKQFFTMMVISLTLLALASVLNAGDVTSIGKGNWSSGAVWSTGQVPGPNDNVKIMGDTITFDMDSTVIASLQVGDGVAGAWLTSKDKVTKLVVTGNILINANAGFKATTVSTGTGFDHIVYLYGNLTNNGNGFDCRVGTSGSNLGTIKFVFLGNLSSRLAMNTSYTSNNGEWNAIVINKSDGAKVIVTTDLYISGGSTSAPAQQSVLTFINGIVETEGNAAFVHMSTTAANVAGANKNSYVYGIFGRGMSSSAGATKEFAVGDGSAFRPVRIMSTQSGSATGHNIRVQCIKGNANTGSSTFPDGLIDKVSSLRYYKVTYSKGPNTGTPTSMPVGKFDIGYSVGDGLAHGSGSLRTGYSIDERATWNMVKETNIDSVKLIVDSVRYVYSDTVTTPITLNDGGSALYLAQARVAGATDISLDGIDTYVGKDYYNSVPTDFNLSQNFPNPFNPTTTILYSIPVQGLVKIKVYDILGKEVATLVNHYHLSGNYSIDFDAEGLTSGTYIYKIEAPGFVKAKKMTVVK